MNNTASSYAISGARSKFEDDLAFLSEMFPACDVSVLRNYLKMFTNDPNYMSAIVNMLLESDNSSSVNQEENLIKRQSGNSQRQYGLKRSANAGEDSLQNELTSKAAASSSKVTKLEFSRKESNLSRRSAMVLGEIEERGSQHGMFGNNTGEAYTKCTSKSSPSIDGKESSPRKVFKCDFNDNNKATCTSSKPAAQPTCAKTTSTSSEEDEIVFVKSVASSPKPCFYRTGNCDPETSSPRQRTGICIRHKGGTLHPSMNKPKKLQIVELGDDDDDVKSGAISQPKKAHSLSCQSPTNTSKFSATVTATSVATDDAFPKLCTSVGSVSQEIATKNNASVNSSECSGFKVENQDEEVSSSENNHLPVTETLSDLEILRKVFPEADPEFISSLLDKYPDQPNRVALVGKELGGVTKKLVQSVPWFWQTEDGKLVPFTGSECNALEKEFSSHDPSHPDACTTYVKVRLPGSAKTYNVNFAAMVMTCDKGQITMIVRAPGGSDDNKQIGGKSLVPQEALTVPTDWQQQNGSVELISVRPGSAEWEHVERSLKRSLRGAQVTDIQRVQNKWLYRKYAIQRHLIKDKNGPTCINEKELFHGTRYTNPDVIWTGEDGFDMRHSADGMWGRGTYFASEAAYCHQGFVYYDPQRKLYQLFLAHVLTGDSVCLPPDRNIKMPPPKRGSTMRYDSVNGVTNGCTVYILYKLDMAYPAYLITYTINN